MYRLTTEKQTYNSKKQQYTVFLKQKNYCFSTIVFLSMYLDLFSIQHTRQLQC